ncbi:MAG: CPBP family intramembrane metalloprotease [Myxococcales bacterium]|nr:CPBP family intramembrane metalloprotease [Myxococcales bacterium]
MPPKTTASKRERPRAAGLRGWFARTNLLTSLILVFPLYLFYQVGVVLLPGVGNGADFMTGELIRLLGRSRAQYLLLHLILALAFLLLVLVLRRKQHFDLRLFLPVTLESAIYALTMGTLILQGMGLVGIDPSLDVGAKEQGGILTRVALSIGAGVHEELVFRLILLGGLVALLEKAIGAPRWIAIALGFAVTAVLFSAAHHVIGGEPWHLGPFVYRLFCGLFFAALYQWRGFAIAVYTHALYDVYVMVLR